MFVFNFVISFPGGLRDETDTDFIHTALRETEEELRISKDKIDVWGTMSSVPGKVSTPIHGRRYHLLYHAVFKMLL